MGCDYTENLIIEFSDFLFDELDNGKTGEQLRSSAITYLKTIKDEMQKNGYPMTLDFLDVYSDGILAELEDAGVNLKGIDKGFIQDIIENPNKVAKELESLDNTTASLDITAVTKKEFRKDFIEKIYDGADIVRNRAVKNIEFNLCKALLFDRDNGTLTYDEHDLNNKIKSYQSELFDTVFNYLKLYYRTANKNVTINYELLNNSTLSLYTSDLVYTGNFEKLFPIAANLFNTYDRLKLNRALTLDKEGLKAFNAFQTLLHFDEFLLNSFGSAINIADMNVRFTNKPKYKLASKATNMFWNNQADDDIDLSKSINNISKMLIVTTRMYDFNTGNLLEDTFLNFNLFISIISKIKDLSTKHELLNSFKLNEETSEGPAHTFKTVSPSTLAYIRSLGPNATLSTIINTARKNPLRNYSALFEILSDSSIRNDSNFKLILKEFNSEEKNVIYSLNKEIYANQGTSLCRTQKLSGFSEFKADYMNYILQTSDSTLLVKNCQYFEDPETRQVIIKTLLSSNVGDIQRRLNDFFNIQNSPKINTAYKKYNARYINSKGFEFTINKVNVLINNTGILTVDGKSFTQFMQDKPIDFANEFIADMLHMNLDLDSKLFENFKYVTNSKNNLEALSRLMAFSGELLHGQFAAYHINEALKDPNSWKVGKDVVKTTKDVITETARKYFPSEYYKNQLGVKFQYRNIDIVPKKLLTTIENLAEAKAITDGAQSASQVTDSEGKALSNSTPSRLLSDYEQQFEDIRNDVNAPSHNFLIVNDPKTLVDIQTVREFNSSSEDNKTYNQFNTREFLESGVLFDFLNGIVSENKGKYNLLQEDNLIAITPSVNSDKNTISKMIINTSTLLAKINKEFGTKYKNIKDFLIDGKNNANEYLKDVIDLELASYYSTIISKIENDYAKLHLTANNRGSATWDAVMGEDFKFTYNKLSFDFITTLLNKYNERHYPNMSMRQFFNKVSLESGVKINELLHVVFARGGVIGPNHSLLMLYNRYNHNNEALIENGMPNSDQFWKYKNSELILALIKNECDLNTLSNPDLYKFLSKNNFIYKENKKSAIDYSKSWVNPSGRLIYGKYTFNGLTINISSELDLAKVEQLNPEISESLQFMPVKEALLNVASSKVKPFIIKARTISELKNMLTDDKAELEMLKEIESDMPKPVKLKDNLHIIAGNLKLNPLLETYNMMDYLYSQEWILSTVGSHINHPNKKYNKNCNSLLKYLEDEAARFQAQHKRNVSYTASMHEFLLNQLNGIPSTYNIACVLDIQDLVNNLGGDIKDVKPFDGSTFVNPFIVWLENNSLNGERAGIHKKQFIHFYDKELGTGGIIKTAGFGLTNSWMRNSTFLLNMMLKMTDYKWTRGYDNIPTFIDITLKNQALRSDPTKKAENRAQYDKIFYSKPILDEWGNWKYEYYKIKEITPIYEDIQTESGNTISNFTGRYTLTSVKVNNRGDEIPTIDKIEPETTPVIDSNYKVWKYVFQGLNSVGFNEHGILSNKGNSGEGSILNTVHAINQCGYLLNGYTEAEDLTSYYQPMKHSDTHYWPTEGSLKQGIANFNTKNIYYDGNKTNRYLIEMLLAGIQLDKEHHADNSEISMMTLVVSACASLGYSWNEANKLYNALYQLTLQGINPYIKPLEEIFALDTDEAKLNLLKAVTLLIVKNLANGSQSKDGVIFNIVSDLVDKYRNGQNITSFDLENNPIPFSDPSTFKKISSIISSALTSLAIKLKFKGILSVLVPSHEIMKLYGGKLQSNFVNFEEEIKEMLAKYDRKYIPISQVRMGRTYKVLNAEGAEIDKFLVQSPVIPKKYENDVFGNPNIKYIGYYKLRELMKDPKYEGVTLVEDITNGRNLGSYFCTFNAVSKNEEINGKTFNFYDLATVKTMFEQGSTKLLRVLLQQDLIDLKEKGKATLNIDGEIYEVQLDNLQIDPYEIIMPKTMADLLGLSAEDDLYNLVNNENAFTAKLISNLTNKIDNEDAYTLALKRLNGKHVYILSRDQLSNLHPKDLIKAESYPPVVDADGNVYKVDSEGNYIHKMASINDEIYLIDGQEVIVTDNVAYYAEHISYNTVYASNQAFKILKKGNISDYAKIVEQSKISNNKSLKNWINTITRGNENLELKYVIKNNNDLGSIRTNDGGRTVIVGKSKLDDYIDKWLHTLGDELYTSFKKSLDIIAARIPAQSMQSFMPMKVVGYEDFDINTAYVSTDLIWLLGSDYDIDAVSLLTYVIGDDGKFVGWSPLFDYSTEENLEISTQFNYPTGKDLELVNYEDVEEDLVSVIKLFSKPFSMFGDRFEATQLQELVNLVNDLSEKGYIIDFDTIADNKLQEAVKQYNKEEATVYAEEHTGENKENTGGYTVEGVKTLFNVVKNLVNRHNQYVNTNHNVEAFTKNYVVLQMFTIAMDPRNLLQAQQSVDQTTDEPKKVANKSAAEALLKSATPGNIANKFQSIEDNHVGKEVIGISAVGLKAFFGITLYVNTVLNQGTAEDINKLLSHTFSFAGKEYTTIANANFKGTNNNIDSNKLNEDILQRLNNLQAYDGNDAALLLSALLSLATDNAKELCLAKLNANADMAGMYIYGLSMGVPFDLLGTLLMSDIGDTVAGLLKGSLITDNLNINTIDLALKFIEDPIKNLKKVLLGTHAYENFSSNQRDPKSNMWGLLANHFIRSYGKTFIDFTKTFKNFLKDHLSLEDFLNYSIEGIEAGTVTLQEVIDKLELLRDVSKNIPPVFTDKPIKEGEETVYVHRGELNLALYNNAIDMLEKAIAMKAKLIDVEKDTWEGALQDFINLHKGAEEFSTIGALFGANQGVKNTDVDYHKFIKKFEGIINKRKKSAGETEDFKADDGKLDIENFMLDPNYLKEKIEIYDKIAFTFNPLDIITTVPHYYGYLKAAATKHMALKRESIKYRTMYELLKNIDNVVGNIKIDKKIKALDKLVEYKLINTYFNNAINLEGAKGKYFYIPENFELVELTSTNSSKGFSTKEPLRVYLGTQGGNATFKSWVEKEVIPNLKKGKLNKNDKYIKLFIKDNEFILKLQPNIYSLNPSKNASISLSVGINMSPRNEEDRAIVDRVRQAFDSLGSSYSVTLNDGTQFSLPIKDIFFYYNLIAYNGANGEASLTKMFDNYVNSPGSEYFNFIKSTSKLDNSKLIFNISKEELINWVAQIESPYSSYSNVIYYKNKDTLRVELLHKAERMDDNAEIQVATVGNYQLNSKLSTLDADLILHNPYKHDDLIITITSKGGLEYNVVCDPVLRSIKKVLKVTSKEDNTEVVEEAISKDKLEVLRTEFKKENPLFDYNPESDLYFLQEDIVKKLIDQQEKCNI